MTRIGVLRYKCDNCGDRYFTPVKLKTVSYHGRGNFHFCGCMGKNGDQGEQSQ